MYLYMDVTKCRFTEKESAVEELALEWGIFIYIYTCMCTCIYVYIHICTQIYVCTVE